MYINPKNKFKQRFFQEESVYKAQYDLRMRALLRGTIGDADVPSPDKFLKEAVQIYHTTVEQLYYTPTTDPAFEYLYREETSFRKLCFYAHVVNQSSDNKQFCLYAETETETANGIIEVLNVYGFGYTFVSRYSGDKKPSLVIDLRGKDFDSEEFLEAWSFISDVTNPTRWGSKAILTLEYAGCFFE